MHFGAEVDTFGKDNDIVVSLIGERNVSVHLGFLKLGYRYEVSVLVPLPENLIDSHDMFTCKEPNVNCKINKLDTNENGLLLNLDFLAYKEKLMREELSIIGGENEQILTLQVLARVLGLLIYFVLLISPI